LVGVRGRRKRRKEDSFGVSKKGMYRRGNKPKGMLGEGFGDGWMKLLWWSAGQTRAASFPGSSRGIYGVM
jgi:hypothetical protein